jgi:Rv2525c-like, glycoside hydrolase-like domain
MRRAIAAAVMGVLVFLEALTTPAFAAANGAGKAANPGTASRVTVSATAMKTVVYDGYEFRVPASWPVYRLDQNPQTCVRYDVNAVYLGAPGASMRCPVGLVGRAQSVSFIPGGDISGPGAGSMIQPSGTSTELQPISAVHSAITQNAAGRVLQVALGAGALGATVLGTYGADPAVIQQVLTTLKAAPADAAGQTAVGKAASGPVSTSWAGVPRGWPVEIVQPAPKSTPPPPKPAPPVNGFDACSAPSLTAMRAGRAQFAAVGIYIGGVNRGCAQPNLSSTWITDAAGMGWQMLPLYAGPQASCWGGGGVFINPATAAAQGVAAAADAVNDARAFGLAAGSPIYYDMESYAGGASCDSSVLTFLSAWDRQVTAAGYTTGLYSSNDTGIANVQAAKVAKQAGFTPPVAIWDAIWDGSPTLSDIAPAWPLTDRSKQYAGNVNVTMGGTVISIDEDYVGGPRAR